MTIIQLKVAHSMQPKGSFTPDSLRCHVMPCGTTTQHNTTLRIRCKHTRLITGPPTHCVGGQTSDALWRLSSLSVVVCNTPWRGPVPFRPVTATPCLTCLITFSAAWCIRCEQTFAASCGILRHVATKTTQHAVWRRLAPHHNPSVVNTPSLFSVWLVQCRRSATLRIPC